MTMGNVVALIRDDLEHGGEDDDESARAVALDTVLLAAAQIAAGSMQDEAEEMYGAFAFAMQAVTRACVELGISMVTVVKEE